MLFNELAITLISFTAGLSLFSALKVDTLHRKTFFIITALIFIITGVNFGFASQSVSFIAGSTFLIAVRHPPLLGAPIYILFLFLIPSVSHVIGIQGVINKIMDLNWLNYLTILVAFLALLSPRKRWRGRDKDINTIERFLLAYCLFFIAVSLYRFGFTSGLRSISVIVPQLYLPFWIASRTCQDMQAIRRTLWAGLIILTCLSVLGVVEAILSWHPYSVLAQKFGITGYEFKYLDRSGILRAYAIFGRPLVFGALLAIALSFWAHLMMHKKSFAGFAIFFVLLAGLYATGARGSWIAAIFGMFLYLMQTSGIGRAVARFSAGGVALMIIALFTGTFDRLIQLLPFVGKLDTGSISYRLELLETGLASIKNDPLFGRSDYLNDPAFGKLIQGQGIIDVVNSYLAIALEFGLVGLALFVMPVLITVYKLWRRGQSLRRTEPAAHRLTAGLLSSLFMLSVILMTTSALNHLPYMLSLLMGLSAACLRLGKQGDKGQVTHKPSAQG